MRRHPDHKMRAGEHGSALLIALFLALIISGLCTTLILTSGSNHLVAGYERDRDRALFAAKAGLNYGYYLFLQGQITPTPEGAPFDSFDDQIQSPLEGATFAGRIHAEGDRLYRMVVTGNYNRSNRTAELVFETSAGFYQYGFVGFNEVQLHVHSPYPHESFEIKTTVFSNDRMEMNSPIKLDGTIVASGALTVDAGSPSSRITGDVFGYRVDNGGVIEGDVRFVGSVDGASGPADIVDQYGNPYVWYRGRNNPDSFVSGSGSVQGSVSRHVVDDGEVFEFSIFNEDGTLASDPALNVVRYMPPPKLDYAAMKAEADLNQPTYFSNTFLATKYLASKKVVEVVGGQTLTTVKIGTPSAPEFIYVDDDLPLTFDPAAPVEGFGQGIVRADGLHIEGGIYTSGDFSFSGRVFTAPARHPEGYDQLRINALPYCLPAIIAYGEPTHGTISTWTPDDTPPMMLGNQSRIEVRSHHVGPIRQREGSVHINGLTYAEFESHFHHVSDAVEMVTMNGAQLAYLIHDCDHFKFTYDPAVTCTRFLDVEQGGGAPSIVSYRELR